MGVYAEGWKPVPCKDHTKCGIWQTLGYEPRTCPTCTAHIMDGICLNACHLSPATQARFAQAMRLTTGKPSSGNPAGGDAR